MIQFRFIGRHGFLSIALIAATAFACLPGVSAQNAQRTPSDTMRDFYKAMRERRFRDAWAMTIYKAAVEGLTAEEMEDLRPTFEEQAAEIPEQIEITGEQISGNNAIVFIKVPAPDVTQITSKPTNLVRSGGAWIIGTEADQAIVKKAGRRYFLDALIEGNQGAVEDLLKRLIAVQIAYSQGHNGLFGDLKALIAAGLMSNEVGDPVATGYSLHVTLTSDGKGYVAGAEPVRYGRTGKLSFWMDQTGAIKSLDNGGKPLSAPK
jgi:hypothetical protein